MGATRIQCLGGLDTIGGNIVLIEHDNYRVITDFGAQVGAANEDLMDPSKAAALVQAGLLPRVDGIYPENQIKGTGLEPYERQNKKTIICLSHLHIDHLGSLKHLSPVLPIYALAEAVPFYQNLVDSGFLADYQIQLQAVAAGTPLEFGPFTIQFHPSDHDTLGAAAIFMSLPDCQLIHSGDLRTSGFHPDRVWSWAQAARQKEIDCLFIEGTSFSEFADRQTETALALAAMTTSLQAPTELALLRQIEALMRQHSETLFAFNGYPQNVERFVQVVALCQRMSRQVLVQDQFYRFIQAYLPADLAVQPISPAILTEIKERPGNYLIQVDQDFLSMIDSLPQGIYLHSNGEPLGLFMPGYEVFVRGIVDRGWDFYQADVSGHAEQRDLLNLAYLTQAKSVVPWHSFNRLEFSQALERQGLRTWLPVKNQWYSIEEIKQMVNQGKEGME